MSTPILPLSGPSPAPSLSTQNQAGRAASVSAASPALSAYAGTATSNSGSLTAPEQLNRAIRRLLDESLVAPEGVSLAKVQSDLAAFSQSVQAAFAEPSSQLDERLERVKTSLQALEWQLRTSGLGAIPLQTEAAPGPPVALDMVKLASERSAQTQNSFAQRQKVKERAGAVGAVLKAQ